MTFLRKRRVDTNSIDDENAYLQIENQVSAYDVNNAEIRSRSFYVNQAIGQLLPDDAAIITMFYKGEQSLEEIAQAMGMQTNTVKVKNYSGRDSG